MKPVPASVERDVIKKLNNEIKTYISYLSSRKQNIDFKEFKDVFVYGKPYVNDEDVTLHFDFPQLANIRWNVYNESGNKQTDLFPLKIKDLIIDWNSVLTLINEVITYKNKKADKLTRHDVDAFARTNCSTNSVFNPYKKDFPNFCNMIKLLFKCNYKNATSGEYDLYIPPDKTPTNPSFKLPKMPNIFNGSNSTYLRERIDDLENRVLLLENTSRLASTAVGGGNKRRLHAITMKRKRRAPHMWQHV